VSAGERQRTTSRRALLRGAAVGWVAGAPAALAAQPQIAAAATAAAAAGPTRRRRHYVDCRYGQLHVTTTGPAGGPASRPAVVCLPMSPRSGRDFDDFAAALGTDRQVHCPDLPGFGGSDAPPAPPALDDYAAAVIEGLGQPGFARAGDVVDIVGQHTGAAVAIEIARRAPALVRRLVLIGVPLFTDAERQELRAQVVKPRPYFEDPEFLCRTWQRDVKALEAGQSRANMLLRFTEIMRAGEGSWWGFNAVFNYPTRERLPGVTQPTLGVVLDERIGPATREAMRLVARGEVLDLAELPGSALDFAAPRLAAAARAFLDRG
jgi:pimeloyl-ACP methyl ester carboxylesterase